MGWPQATDYNEAVQNPRTCFCDPELQAAEVTVNALGLPMPRSGNFADVYQFRQPAGQRSWAVKCFTREVPGLDQRYAAISHHLQRKKLPFMVDFKFLTEGVRIRGLWFPIVKMRWIEGLTLNEFVRDCLDRPNVLTNLAQIWVRLAKELRDAGIAHGDLQHGNVLLVTGSQSTSLAVKLVDYDGMYVPALIKNRSAEVGHPNYQHPERLREGSYGYEVDRFSHLVIYIALRALALGGKSLWDRHDSGDNLLFRDRDFQFPETSTLFKELWNMGDTQLQELAGHLILATRVPVERVPLLSELVEERSVKPLTPAQRKQVQALVDQNIPVGELVSPAAAIDSKTPWWNAGGPVAGPSSSARPEAAPPPFAKPVTAPADAPLKQRLEKKRKAKRPKRRQAMSNLAVSLILGSVALVGLGLVVGFGYYIFGGDENGTKLTETNGKSTKPGRGGADIGNGERVFPPAIAQLNRAPGLIAELYPNRDFNGKAHVRIDSQIDFHWEKGSPAPGVIDVDNFAVRWTGWLRITQPGKYKLITRSEDGAKLMLDGEWLIPAWNPQQQGVETNAKEIDLTEGDHEIRVDYFAAFQNAEMQLLWDGPGIAESPIPTTALFHDAEKYTQLAAVNADYQPPNLGGAASGTHTLPPPGRTPGVVGGPNSPVGTPPGSAPAPPRPPRPARRNPFGMTDVPEPDGPDVLQAANAAAWGVLPRDPNEQQWSPRPSNGSRDSLEGQWHGRWKNQGGKWNTGSAQVRVSDDRVFILYEDEQRYLIELRRSPPNRLIGKYVNVNDPKEHAPFLAIIVSPERIDGWWTGGRWDLRRQLK